MKNSDENTSINNFLNMNNPKLIKYKNVINICNDNKSNVFNELLLFFFEGQCQTYFLNILTKHNNIFNTNCCEELLLNISFQYFKKAIKYI